MRWKTLVLCGLWAGCLGASTTPGTKTSSEGCEDCLASGGTWQPEASECTKDCNVQDISCFRDTCPPACSESCDGCFSQTECEAATCQWNQEAEATWCSAPSK